MLVGCSSVTWCEPNGSASSRGAARSRGCHPVFGCTCLSDPFTLGWKWILSSTARAGNTFGDVQIKTQIAASFVPLGASGGGSWLGAAGQPGAPASPSPCLLRFLLPGFLLFLSSQVAGSVKSMGFSSTQDNKKNNWKMQRLFCSLLSLASLELSGLILILLNRGLSHRESLTLMGSKASANVKITKQRVMDVPDSDLFPQL